MFESILSLFYPNLCPACNRDMKNSQADVCLVCFYRLPYTKFETLIENMATDRLWGKVPYIWATSFLYFNKNNATQKLIHQIKYRNNPELGQKLAERFGKKLSENQVFKKPDLIIPVPIHPKRLRQRGYNQASFIAQGFSNVFEVPVREDIIKKATESSSQTKKSRMTRFENVDHVFALGKNHLHAQGKHILLVDDVLTTGATVEMCWDIISQIPDVEISVATLAIAV